MCKLKIRLEKQGNRAILFEVLEMDERFRSKVEDKMKKFEAKNGLKVISSFCPDSNTKEIFLRGDDNECDDVVCISNCKTIKERDETYDKILEALRDWADNWEGWKEEKPPKKEDTIYKF